MLLGLAAASAAPVGARALNDASALTQIRLADDPTWKVEDYIDSIKLSNDGTRIATGYHDGSVRLWAWDGSEESLLSTAGGTLSRSYQNDGVTSCDEADARGYVSECAHDSRVRSVAFNSDHTKLLTCGGNGDSSGQIMLWSINNDQLTLIGTKDQEHCHSATSGCQVTACEFSPTENKFASTGFGGKLKVWDASTFTSSATHLMSKEDACSFRCEDLAYSADGEAILTTTSTTADLWDVSSTQQITRAGNGQPDFADMGSGHSCAISPDKAYFAIGGNGRLRLFNAETYETISSVTQGSGAVPVRTVVFSPDGQTLVSHDRQGDTRLWDVSTPSALSSSSSLLRLLNAASGSGGIPGDWNQKIDVSANYLVVVEQVTEVPSPWPQLDHRRFAVYGGYQFGTGGASGGGGGASGDPHLAFGHGGKADFRGTDKGLYNFLSAKNVSLNVMTEFADFRLHGVLVHGSFMTQAHVVAKSRAGRTVHASYWAEKIGQQNAGWMNGTIDGQPAFSMGAHGKKQIDDVTLSMDYSSLHVVTSEWEVVITPQPVYDHVAGPTKRLDVQVKARVPEEKFAVPPHGIIGQSWDRDHVAVNGKQDVYPNTGEFTTSAMAEGAIEGAAIDYLMPSRFSTAFKYSRYGADQAPIRRVAELAGQHAVASLSDGAVASERA